jgi:hypothetical protein
VTNLSIPTSVRAAALVVSVLAALTGCATHEASTMTTHHDSGYTLLQEPPANPPAVTANRTSLTVTQFQWWSNGHSVEHLVTDPSTVPLPAIDATNGKLAFAINSGVLPYQLVLTLFGNLDAEGRPTSDTGHQVDCLKSTRCTLRRDKNEINFEVDGIVGGQVAMLQIGYLKLLTEQGAKEPSTVTLSASWTMRTTTAHG